MVGKCPEKVGGCYKSREEDSQLDNLLRIDPSKETGSRIKEKSSLGKIYDIHPK